MKKIKMVFLIIIFGLILVNLIMENPENPGAVPTSSTTSSPSLESNDVEMVLDAMSFYDGNKTISESKLIELKGEPDEIEEWNYKRATDFLTYPIRTLYYGNYAYHFNNGMLHRISIHDAEIPYKNKEDILKMFGLKKYINSEVTDTNFAYRVTNCGVYEFWVPIMDEDSLNAIRISYSSLFK